MNSSPTISAVIAAYNSEAFIEQTLESILGQTRQPDEVVVVDDGSTDGTARRLAGFGDRIRVVSRLNGGCPAAFNTGFAAAHGAYVAMCGADDVWEPRKLEWQADTLARHPKVDIACGHAEVFGLEEGAHPRPPRDGVLDRKLLQDHLFRGNTLCAPSVLVRRSLFQRLGPFVEGIRRGENLERFNADDYEYWMRALSNGAVFFYDPRPLLHYRRHDANLTNDFLHQHRSAYLVHRRYADEIGDRRLVRATLAHDLFSIARETVDAGRPHQARAAFRRVLRYRPMPRALAWMLVLSLPAWARESAGKGLISLKRRMASPSPSSASRWPG